MSSIDIKQQVIRTLRENKESPKLLKEQLEKNRFIFDDAVDNAQSKIDQTSAKIFSTEAKNILIKVQDRIALHLAGIANKGYEILKSKSEFDEKYVSLEGLGLGLQKELNGLQREIDQSVRINIEEQLAIAKKSLENTQISNNDQQIQQLDESLLLYGNIRRDLEENSLISQSDRQKFYQEISSAIETINQKKLFLQLNATVTANKWNHYVEIGTDKKSSKTTIKFTVEFKKLTPDEKNRIFTTLGAVRDGINEISDDTTHEKITENFWMGKKLFLDGDLLEAKKYLEEFISTDIKSEKFQNNKELKKKEKMFIDSVKTMMEVINDVKQTNTDFLNAHQAALEGDFVLAKKLFKLCLRYEPSDPKDKVEYKNIIEAELRTIALREALQAQIHLTQNKEEIFASTAGTDNMAQQTQKEISLEKQLTIIQKIISDIEAGKFNDYNDALKTYAAEIDQLEDKNSYMRNEFVLMRDLIIAREGRKGYLTIARRFRGIDPGEAEKYFRMYFKDKIETAKKKNTTFESVRNEYEEKPKFAIKIQLEIQKYKDKYEEAATASGNADEYKTHHPFNEKQLREQLTQISIKKIYDEIVLQNEQKFGYNKPEHFESLEEADGWNEFMKMKGYSRIGTSTEGFELSDDQINSMVSDALIEVPFIVLGGIGASIAARSVARGILSRGLSTEANAYLAMNRTIASEKQMELMMELADSVTVGKTIIARRLTETTVFTAIYGLTDSERALPQSWYHIFRIYGAHGHAEKINKFFRLGKLSSTAVELLVLSTVDEELSSDQLNILGAQKIEDVTFGNLAQKAIKKK